jgi:hypothetical protein
MRTLLLPFLFISSLAFGQAAGDYNFLKKNVGPGFSQVWLTPSSTDRIGFDGAGGLTTYPAGGGTGDVVGPASSTANNIPQWDGITGKLLKDGLSATIGGGGAADALKLVQYSTGNGGLSGGDLAGGIGVHGYGDPAVQGNSNFGIALYGNVSGAGAMPLRLSHLGGTGDFMACWAGGVDNVFEVGQDGALSWPLGGTALTGTRTNLGLGTLATQSGTFSGTSSGTNTGDQTTIVGITGTLAEFNTSLTGADFATGGGTATGTNTGDQTTVSGNAGTATALQTARNINGVAFDGTANISITEHHAPFIVRAATPFPYTNLPAAANFFQDAAPHNVFPCDLTHATQARIYVYTVTTGSAGSKLSIRYKTGAWSATASDYADIGTSEVACTVAAANTFTDSGWVNLTAGAKADIHVSVFGLGGNGTADPTFNILGVQFR